MYGNYTFMNCYVFREFFKSPPPQELILFSRVLDSDDEPRLTRSGWNYCLTCGVGETKRRGNTRCDLKNQGNLEYSVPTGSNRQGITDCFVFYLKRNNLHGGSHRSTMQTFLTSSELFILMVEALPALAVKITRGFCFTRSNEVVFFFSAAHFNQKQTLKKSRRVSHCEAAFTAGNGE